MRIRRRRGFEIRDLAEHVAFANFEHMHLLTYMQLADSKASVFLAVTSGAIAYIVGHYGLGWLWPEHVTANLVVLASATTMLGISAAYALAVIVPRFGSRAHSVIAFPAVLRRPSAREYAAVVRSRSAPELFEDQMRYCFDLAGTCGRKYRLLDRSLVTGAIGYAALLAALVMLWGG